MVAPIADLDQMSSTFSPELARGHRKTFYKVPVIKVYGVTEGGQVRREKRRSSSTKERERES